MRFKKRSKVEVFSKKEVPSGAWRCAEIISGNGHNYTVKYACSPGMTSKAIVERVSRRAIRPFPPPMDGVESWAAGDVVEVFDDLYWKIATVSKAMSGNSYLVRLLASSREFRVHKVNIRARQLWKNDEWVAIGKGSGSGEIVKSNKMSTLDSYRKMSFPLPRADAKFEVQGGYNCLAVQNSTGFQESHVVSARTLKRASPFCSYYAQPCVANNQKMRAIGKEGERQRLVSGYPSTLLEKVDAVAYPRENLGDTYMHASSNNRTNGYYDMERRKSNCVVECFRARSSEDCDSDINTCSVGSCSVNSNNLIELSSRILAGPSQDDDAANSDAESFYGRGEEEEKYPLSVGEDIATKIHRLELHAYRCTLEALYASGALSWEQEALLTNLRLSLNISNDEHLMELRNLISAGTSLY